MQPFQRWTKEKACFILFESVNYESWSLHIFVLILIKCSYPIWFNWQGKHPVKFKSWLTSSTKNMLRQISITHTMMDDHLLHSVFDSWQHHVDLGTAINLVTDRKRRTANLRKLQVILQRCLHGLCQNYPKKRRTGKSNYVVALIDHVCLSFIF